MSTGIDALLAAASGPKRLRQELQQKTESIAGLSRLLAAPETLQSSIPSGLLGGELLALLSNRLQKALLFAAEGSPQTSPQPGTHIADLPPEAAPSAAGERRTFLPLAPTAAAAFTQVPGASQSAGSPKEPLAQPGATRARKRPWETAIQSSARPGPDPGPAHPAPEHRNRPILAPQPQPRAAGRLRSETPLARQLRRYWQRSEPETTSPLPADLPGAEARRQSGSSWPHPALNPAPARTWPDLVGQATARKVNELQRHAYGAGEQSQQAVHAGAPENVEIRNVFNIALPGSDDGYLQASTQLAESIADILREQALQHGIDLT